MGAMSNQVYSKKNMSKEYNRNILKVFVLAWTRIKFNVTDKSRSKAVIIIKESRTNKG